MVDELFSREAGDKLPPGVIKTIRCRWRIYGRSRSGTKVAGRHGNKGVISRVVSVQDMPFIAWHPIDVILTPLGVVSCMNLGQILGPTSARRERPRLRVAHLS